MVSEEFLGFKPCFKWWGWTSCSKVKWRCLKRDSPYIIDLKNTIFLKQLVCKNLVAFKGTLCEPHAAVQGFYASYLGYWAGGLLQPRDKAHLGNKARLHLKRMKEKPCRMSRSPSPYLEWGIQGACESPNLGTEAKKEGWKEGRSEGGRKAKKKKKWGLCFQAHVSLP